MTDGHVAIDIDMAVKIVMHADTLEFYLLKKEKKKNPSYEFCIFRSGGSKKEGLLQCLIHTSSSDSAAWTVRVLLEDAREGVAHAAMRKNLRALEYLRASGKVISWEPGMLSSARIEQLVKELREKEYVNGAQFCKRYA